MGEALKLPLKTNPVWWQIELASLQRGFAGLFETSCEQTPGFGFASPVCLASNGWLRRPNFEGFRFLKLLLFKDMTLPFDRAP